MQRAESAHATELVLPSEVPTISGLRSSALRVALVGLVVAYLAGVLIGPIVALALESHDVGLEALIRSLTTAEALGALRMSLVLFGIAVVVNALVGTLGAIYILRQRFWGRAYLNAVCDLPLAVSPVMIGLAFILLVGRDGLATPLFDALGIKMVFSFPGLVLATLFVTLPYAIREVVYVLEEIGTSEEEAAITLGASPFQAFFRVTLPNIRLALGYGLLMTAARALGEFGAVLVLGGSIARHTQTATTFIHDAIEERDLASAYGMACVLALSSITLLILLETFKRRTHQAMSREDAK
jgi:sulfate/thiosulfate transport system permease protein